MKVSDFQTAQIMVYAEMVSKQFEELYDFDVQVVMCHQHGGLLNHERDAIRKDIGVKMVELEGARVSLVREINRRIKRDLGIKFGPSDIQPYINKYVKKHPLIGKGEAEIKTVLSQKAKEKVKTLKKA